MVMVVVMIIVTDGRGKGSPLGCSSPAVRSAHWPLSLQDLPFLTISIFIVTIPFHSAFASHAFPILHIPAFILLRKLPLRKRPLTLGNKFSLEVIQGCIPNGLSSEFG